MVVITLEANLIAARAGAGNSAAPSSIAAARCFASSARMATTTARVRHSRARAVSSPEQLRSRT